MCASMKLCTYQGITMWGNTLFNRRLYAQYQANSLIVILCPAHFLMRMHDAHRIIVQHSVRYIDRSDS